MELIFFAYTPPLDGKNTASEEHKGIPKEMRILNLQCGPRK